MNDKSNLVLLMFKDSWLLYLLRNSFRDFKIVSGEQLYNCIWLQSRGPNVIEFQVDKKINPDIWSDRKIFPSAGPSAVTDPNLPPV